MRLVQLWTLCVVALSANCYGFEKSILVPEDPIMDPVLDLLLQEELEVEETSDDAVIEGELPQLAGEDWLCGVCQENPESRIIYSETTELVMKETQLHAEFQVSIAVDENMSCVRVSGASSLQVSLIEGGCTTSAATLALRTGTNNEEIRDRAYSVLIKVYGA